MYSALGTKSVVLTSTDSILSDSSIDFGEYALGRELKREMIMRELT
jgi:hypothetical protein